VTTAPDLPLQAVVLRDYSMLSNGDLRRRAIVVLNAAEGRQPGTPR